MCGLEYTDLPLLH